MGLRELIFLFRYHHRLVSPGNTFNMLPSTPLFSTRWVVVHFKDVINSLGLSILELGSGTDFPLRVLWVYTSCTSVDRRCKVPRVYRMHGLCVVRKSTLLSF